MAFISKGDLWQLIVWFENLNVLRKLAEEYNCVIIAGDLIADVSGDTMVMIEIVPFPKLRAMLADYEKLRIRKQL
jgi:hypothetical protein